MSVFALFATTARLEGSNPGLVVLYLVGFLAGVVAALLGGRK